MAAIKAFHMKPSSSGYTGTSAVPLIGYNCVAVLAANTVGSIAVPTGAKVAVFSGTGNFWVRDTTMATVPTTTDATGASPQLNPSVRDVSDVTTLFFISDVACSVSVVFYQ